MLLYNYARKFEGSSFKGLYSFINYVNNVAEREDGLEDSDNKVTDGNTVKIITIHSSKGLEFPVVFIPGMEEGIFPGLQSQNDPSELEEERRLAYVAITRAKDLLYISYAKERMMYGRTLYGRLSQYV